VIALVYALWKVQRTASVADAQAVVTPAAIYWHFVDVLWLYVFVILFWL
jgi:heme/copper-type cytochrome/quinol oxidase subunit 3